MSWGGQSLGMISMVIIVSVWQQGHSRGLKAARRRFSGQLQVQGSYVLIHGMLFNFVVVLRIP